jgi:hypothetical protein
LSQVILPAHNLINTGQLGPLAAARALTESVERVFFQLVGFYYFKRPRTV